MILILLLNLLLPLFVQAEVIRLRIALFKDIEELKVKINSDYEIRLPYTEELLKKGNRLSETLLRAAKGGIFVGKKFFHVLGIELQSQDNLIFLNHKPYPGKIRILRTLDHGLLVINIIELEDYLRGVIPHEVSADWPMEALKAQAIVARSYALYLIRENKDKDYDLSADVLSQLYHGRLLERWRARRAINLTRGLVLVYQDKILPAFYHASCGGRTDDASHIWNINLAPLKGVKCDYCKNAPHYRWKRTISFKELKRILNENKINVKYIKDIQVNSYYPTGYVKEVVIKAEKELILSGKEFRRILGYNIIRSRRFSIKTDAHKIIISGYGWGHGIGFCQWGAYFMAKKGFRVKEILSYYYPTAQIRKLTNY